MYGQVERKRVNFGKITNLDYLPNLIQIQKKSFDWFLQSEVKDPTKRKNQGLEAVFRETFPIESPNNDMVMEYSHYVLGDAKKSPQECKDTDATFALPLKAVIRLIIKETGEIREQVVYMGDLPVMTEQGTFIINGAERVVVSQLHRSPGIFFSYDEERDTYSARVIPYRGSWLEFEMDNKGILVAKIDRKKKFPATLLVKSLGHGTNEEILRLFYKSSKAKIGGASTKELKRLIGRRVIADVINMETGEVMLDAGSKINEDNISILKEMKVKEVELVEYPKDKDNPVLVNCLEKDGVNDYEDAVLKFHGIMRQGEPSTIENAEAELNRLFFSPKSFDLGDVGRYKINSKFEFNNPKEFTSATERVLRPADIIETVRYLLNLISETENYYPDDIDHLGNRRIRSVGELIANQLKVGFTRVERVIKERMTVQEVGTQTPQLLISIKPITAVINEFFGSSQLSQFMDQTNPLAELTHKRRLNALGPGGLSRDRAGFEVRDVHYSHYGRMCPIETPEGPNIGLILSMSSYARVNDYGFLETPYRVVKNSKVSNNIEYLTADKEEYHSIAVSSSPVDEKGEFKNKLISTRHRSDYPFRNPNEIQYMDLAPMQVVSVSTALIPFLEHDDANRALMGSNMQRQAVPLLRQEAPFVGTGMETRAAYDSRICIISRHEGVVTYVDAEKVVIERKGGKESDTYDLTKFKKTNQGTCFNQTPVVGVVHSEIDGKVTKVSKEKIEVTADNGNVREYNLISGNKQYQPIVSSGEEVRRGTTIAGQIVSGERMDENGNILQKGTVLADGPAVDNGTLALGRNVLVAFMPWEGYNFEDAILISEKVVKDDIFSSIHIEEFEIQARETKLGQEQITRDIPNLSDKAFRDLDETGVIRVGAEVKPGDILVGMVTPKGETDLTPEYKLLHSIFGEKAKEVRDSSLRMPNGFEGTVIDIKRFSREKGDELPAGVEEMVKVFVARKRKLLVGDKMAGRHGNKGVVARIMAEEDMPYMEDGTPMDIVLNPLGVPSRMNLGQIFETQLGLAASKLGINFETPVFDGATEADVEKYCKEANLPLSSKFKLYDGRTGLPFMNEVFCGYIYMLKLAHLVDDKIHARSTGPYSLVTQQPLGGKAQFGGQRLGEMEVWALEAYGASHTLQELLTIKSDDMLGRARIYEAIVKGIHSIKPGIPESFNVLVQELRGLALDIVITDSEGNSVDISDYEDEYSKSKKKIKFETIENA
ncbi:DNA-directed RNA polymerase subunit beta [Leptospira saintgironsiae]|uniref:DNA-directed RNA polymerase subunit beta n=1 Tax=Leptospira saintgironsiae TaxID=2023183 RepID=A0A2M9YHU1_9LEPT|nr:DNA-directed RNA polymerase subunit beta [Leptospira saintgironsiae]PJZ51111.1 DNA-directed RNA polymerase subunit beta [Leptospira saintgironsiae]